MTTVRAALTAYAPFAVVRPDTQSPGSVADAIDKRLLGSRAERPVN